jgi:hypothetical protein
LLNGRSWCIFAEYWFLGGTALQRFDKRLFFRTASAAAVMTEMKSEAK